MSRVLVAHCSHLGRTRAIAELLAERLRGRGHEVEIGNAREGRLPPPADYDAVILGSCVHGHHHAGCICDYIREHREMLEQMPTGFFSVSVGAALPFAGPDPGGHLVRTFTDLAWRPDHAAAYGRFGTALAYKLADLVAVSLSETRLAELSPTYGPI